MLTCDVYSMPSTVTPGPSEGANVHQYLITRAAKVGLITIEEKTLHPPVSHFCIHGRLAAFAENARQSRVRQQRINLRPAASREPRRWKAFHQLCLDI